VPPIRKLAPDVSSRIAAGEVIERPASVCKELIENAIDALAVRVTIDLSEGGRSSIRVTDDGVGIRAADLPLAVSNFSTSKISSIEDISHISTLGFRGEALASIGAVSRLTLLSRSAEEEVGREMTWKDGVEVRDEPAARSRGTDVTVEDLFGNLPARKKFLASPASELRRISSLVQTYALAYPAISFILRSESSDLHSYPVSGLEERTQAVLGSQVYGHLRFFENRTGETALSGYVSQPDLTRGNRGLQFFFVNGRAVKDRLLSHAVHQAYHALIPKERFPVLVIFLEIPPGDLDVNVHPAKSEVRFRNERELHRFVFSSIREALESTGISFEEKVHAVYQSIFPDRPAGEGAKPDAVGGEQIGWIFKESPEPLIEGERQQPLVSAGNLYWQLHQSFILIQIRGGVVIVDQHAAHERILFDAAKRSLQGEAIPVQPLLFPATLELTPEEYDRYEELSPVLPSLGFEAEPFGPRSVIVRGIPAGVRNWEDGRLLQQILGDEGADLDSILKSYACRSAVKAGTELTNKEMESLADQLFATEFTFTCPHGRPTMLRLSTADLERRFQRTARSEK
jgi:DNA mismatch repair protein MutL